MLLHLCKLRCKVGRPGWEFTRYVSILVLFCSSCRGQFVIFPEITVDLLSWLLLLLPRSCYSLGHSMFCEELDVLGRVQRIRT